MTPNRRMRLKQLTDPRHELLRMHSALYEMGRGRARLEEWGDLADLVIVVDALARLEKLDVLAVAPLVHEAVEGLAVANKVPSGQMRVPAGAAHALRSIVMLYDDCLCRHGQGTIRDAIRLAHVIGDVAPHRGAAALHA